MKATISGFFIAAAFFLNLSAARAGVVINEIMYHPASELSADEWVELYNTDPTQVDVSGWQFSSGVHFIIPAGTTIPASGFLVVAADAVQFHTNHPEAANYVGGWTGHLSNSADTLVLADASNATVNAVAYADDGDWGVRRRDYFADWGHRGWSWDSPADGGQNPTPVFQTGTDPYPRGKSLELINARFDNSSGQNWLASTPNGGTPGAPNSVAATVIAPVILEAAHFPLVPKSTDPISVTALVQSDDLSLPVVTLHWRVCTASSPYADPAFTSTPMFDDGAHNDAGANDSIYGAVLPAQASGAIVEFYFEARDGSGNVRFWPAPALDETLTPVQTQNCLLQVDDTSYAGALPLYRVVLKPADKVELNQINSNNPSAPPYPYGPGETADQTYSHATFNMTWITSDGTGAVLNYLSGARNRGHGSRELQPQGINASFPNSSPWKKVTSLNLNTQYTYSQLFGSALLRKAGLPCPESRQVQVRVNAKDPTQAIGGSNAGASNDYGHSLGFFVANEDQDSNFLSHDFPLDSSGNLYRSQRSDFTVPPNTMAEGDFSYLAPIAGQQPPDPYRTVWFKHSNASADDWADLIGLTMNLALGHSDSAFNTTYDPGYQAAVESCTNVAEWVNFLACQTIVDNSETSIANGYGDDFYLYIGANDPRAQFVCYDLDTICGQGDTVPLYNTHGLWRMINKDDSAANGPTVLNSFLKFPAFAPLYFEALNRQINSTFLPANFNALCSQILSGVAPTKMASIETFNTKRTAYLATLIPLSISVTTGPAVVNGYPHTTTASTNLVGRANAITTRSVMVNGTAANWSAWQATWAANGVALIPGINRVLIQALDGNGVETERSYYEVWYDNGSTTAVSGTIGSDTTWTATGGPYQVSANMTVASGATLTIEPGTTVYLASGADITVASGGTLNAIGTDTAWILFTRAPAATGAWGNLTINGAIGTPQSTLAYCYFTNNLNDAVTPCIEVAGGFVLFDHLNFGSTGSPYVHLDSAAFLISNCIFPTSSAAFELLHGTGGVRTDHYGIMRDNFFGSTTGYNDIMDFTGGNRDAGEPIIQYYNNVVIGASDDMFDLDGTDAWVEHNIFLHAHKNGSVDSSSAISGGSDSSSGVLRTSEITIIGNLIFDCDQVADAKEGNFFTLINNTIVHLTVFGGSDTEAAVVIDQDIVDGVPTGLGKGFYMNGNIISDVPEIVRNYNPAAVQVTLDDNLLPFAWAGAGVGNKIVDPRLTHVPQVSETNFATFQAAQAMRQWFALLPDSPALGAGPLGRDQGGVLPIGATVSGEPVGTTNQTIATLVVGPNFTGQGIPTAGFPNGSGYIAYQYRLDGGSWSSETAIATPISLTGLSNGPHFVEVIGKNDAGTYQNDSLLGPDATITQSGTWVVDAGYVPPGPAPLVRINEVMAKNTETAGFSGTFPDMAELYNAGNAPADLGGWGLTDSPSTPYKYTFPAGTMLGAGQYLVVYLSSSNSVPQPRTGFSLKDQGDSLTLTKSPAQSGGLADAVSFGPQLADISIGRRPADGGWDMCVPTFGSANIVAAQGLPSSLVINEWLASAATLFSNDFIELFNPSALPVNLGGCYLSDNPTENPAASQIPPLFFVPAGGYALFQADGNLGKGADHLSFKLAATQGEIGLFDSTHALIDSIIFGPQTSDVSQGRTPDGTATIASFNQPTPGGPNPGSTGSTTTVMTNLIPMTGTWKYDQTDTSAPPNWTTPAFNDSAWPSGGATLAKSSTTNSGPYSPPVATALSLGSPERSAFYFRTHFTFSGLPSAAQLQISHFIDDGCVVYLNGTEVYRYNMPTGAVTYSTLATTAISTNQILGPYSISNTSLVTGDNVLAVEVHQVNLTSTDIIMAMQLDSTAQVGAGSDSVVLNEVLALNQSLKNPDGSQAGWIEFYNPGTVAADLTDLSLTTDVAAPRSWVFPSGSAIAPGGYLVIYCNPLAAVSATNTGFALSADGGGVYLFHNLASGGGLQDAVSYGLQIGDFSIARSPNGSGSWSLAVPSAGALNVAAATAQPTSVVVNEWLAGPGPAWFELYNTGTTPAALGGNFLTHNLANRTMSQIPPLSFIGGAGSARWRKIVADSTGPATPGHVSFNLNPAGDSIALFTAAGTELEAISFGLQISGISQGRFPNGASTITSMPPTPGAANLGPATDSDGDGLPDIWEIRYGLDPHNPADAMLDSDGDGQSNLAEFLAGTDPLDPQSVLQLAIASAGAGQYHLRFTARGNVGYTIQYKASLDDATWTHLVDIPAQAAAHAVDYLDTVTAQQRFYRVITPVTP